MSELQDHPWVGVDAIIVDADNRVLLIQRSAQSKSHPSTWGLIGGWMDWGETAEEAVKREVFEEIGVTVRVDAFVGRYYSTKPGDVSNRTRVALPHRCTIVEGEPSVHQEEEVQAVQWFMKEELADLPMAYDHKTMLADEGLV